MRRRTIAVVALSSAAILALVAWTIKSGMGKKAAADDEEPVPAARAHDEPPPPAGTRDVAGLARLTGVIDIGSPRDVADSGFVTDISKASVSADSDYLITAAPRGEIMTGILKMSVRFSSESALQVKVDEEWLDLGPFAKLVYDLAVIGNEVRHLVYMIGCKDDHLNWLCPMVSMYGLASKPYRYPKDHPSVEVDPSRSFNRGRYAIWLPVEEILHAKSGVRVFHDFMGRIIVRGKSRATGKDYVYDVRQGRFKTMIGSG